MFHAHGVVVLLFGPKPIRTISFFLELISRFEFEFCRRGNYFFERFEFLVCSCECAVACLCPRNSISNVAASTIHDDKFLHLNETIVEGRAKRSLILGLGGERQIEH